jgi:hypothetical protein
MLVGSNYGHTIESIAICKRSLLPHFGLTIHYHLIWIYYLLLKPYKGPIRAKKKHAQ